MAYNLGVNSVMLAALSVILQSF